MKRIIDARGIPCPQPVLKTRRGLEETDWVSIEILVDAEAALENVSRMLKSRGYTVEITGETGEYSIHVENLESGGNRGEKKQSGDSHEEPCDASGPLPEAAAIGSVVVYIGSDQIGQGDDELGKILMSSFLYALPEAETVPGALALMNAGVKLAVEGAETLESLRKLEASGMNILVCGTCLDYFDLKDKLRVGIVSNIYDISDLFFKARNVIRI